MVVKVSKPEINVREKISELDKPSGTAGQAMLAAETPQEQQALVGVGRRNLLINGSTQVSQRGTSFTPIVNGTKHIDQYYFENAGSWAGNIEQVSDGPGGTLTKSMKLTTTTPHTPGSSHYCQINHVVEGQNLAHIGLGTASCKPMTLSFWVKSSLSSAMSVQLSNGGTRTIALQYHTSAGQWTYHSFLIPPITDGSWPGGNLRSLEFRWGMGYGSNWNGLATSGQWKTTSGYTGFAASADNAVMSTDNATWQISQIQLEAGKVATPFEHRSYGEELAACQRYAIVYGGAETRHLGTGSMYNAANVNFSIHTPVTMRAQPSLIKKINGSGTWLQVYVGSTGNNSNPTPQLGEGGSTNIFRIYAPGTGLNQSVGSGAWVQVMAGASLELNADL
tara:strand:+ start:2072 stop:3247 length:1176 start_codon:yes stop_codon:yes gene_type:complete